MESTQNSLLNCLLYYQLTMINTHHVASKTLTGIKIAHMKTQHKTYIICTGVVLVVSPAAIVLSMVPACGIHKAYTKHKTYPEGEILCSLSSIIFSVISLRTRDL